MNKKYIKYIIIAILIAALIIAAFKNSGKSGTNANVNKPYKKTIISSTNIENIKQKLVSKRTGDTMVDLLRLSGDDRFIALMFGNENNSNPEENISAIYDMKNKSLISQICLDKKKDIYITTSHFTDIFYIGNKNFVILNEDGSVYLYNPYNEEIKFIKKTEMTKSKYYKSFDDGSYIYVVGRDQTNIMQQYPLTNIYVLKIDKKSLDIKEKYDKDITKMIIGFTYTPDSPGIIWCPIIKNKLSSENLNSIFMEGLAPGVNGNDVFLPDINNIFLRTLKDDKDQKIDFSFMKKSVVERFFIKIPDCINMPVYICKDNKYYIDTSLYDSIHSCESISSGHFLYLNDKDGKIDIFKNISSIGMLNGTNLILITDDNGVYVYKNDKLYKILKDKCKYVTAFDRKTILIKDSKGDIIKIGNAEKLMP